MSVVGVDGCKGGWFAIRLEPDETSSVEVFCNIKELWDKWNNASLILIDIPIGLSDAKRQCDTDARKALGSRHPTVFTPPCREAVQVPCYSEASDCNCKVTGRKLSKQAWAIAPKIKEVDDLMLEDSKARSIIREVHPEICFWAFAGKNAMPNNKKKPAGREERLDQLRKWDTRTDSIFENALCKFLRKVVATDDILDALVAALTAKGDPSELESFPTKPQCDKNGLPMEMVYRL